MIIKIRAKPSSKKEAVNVKENNTFEVFVKEKAEDNKANIAIIKLLSKHFSVSSSNIKIIKGLSSKQKVIEIIQD